MSSAGDDEVSQLKAKLATAESKARDAEGMMFQAAEYGKDLLEKNLSLESSNEQLQQEKHELCLRYQV